METINYQQAVNVTRIAAWRGKKARATRVSDTAFDCAVSHLVEVYGDLTGELYHGIQVAVRQAAEQAIANGSPSPEFVAFQAGIRYYESMKGRPDGAA